MDSRTSQEDVVSLASGERKGLTTMKGGSMVICGDFNYDLLKQPRNHFSTKLKKIGFQQIVTDSTHIKGGLLDHVYFFSPNSMTCKLFKIHPVYYSDHDAVTFILHLGDESSGSQD